MNRSKYMQITAGILTLAETERQLRDVKSLVDRGLATAQRFWLAGPLLFAGWVYVVSDDNRFAVLENLLDHVFNVVPLEPVERWLST